MRKEDEFIKEICSTLFSGDAEPLCHHLKHSHLNWDYLFRNLAYHNIEAGLYYVLKEKEIIHLVSPEICSRLSRKYYETVGRCLAMFNEISRIENLLSIKAIPHLFVKGPLVSEVCYPKGLARRAGDIDLVISRESIDASAESLIKLGYHAKQTIMAGQARFAHETSDIAIDLHWDLTSFYKSIPCTHIPFHDAWNNRRFEIIQDQTFPTLSFEDALIHLCINFVHNHKFSRLVNLIDLGMFIRKYESAIDWAFFTIRTKQFGTQIPAYFALAQVSQFLKVPFPEFTLSFLSILAKRKGKLFSQIVRLEKQACFEKKPLLSYLDWIIIPYLMASTNTAFIHNALVYGLIDPIVSYYRLRKHRS